MTQEDTHANLDALKLEAQKRVEQLTTEKVGGGGGIGVKLLTTILL